MASADDCDKKTFYSPSKPVGGVKPIIPCDPVERKLPQELKEPVDVVTPQPQNKIPKAITLRNKAMQAFCEIDIHDSEGYPGTGQPAFVAAGTLTDVITVQTIASIPESVLNYISLNSLEDELETLLNTRVTDSIVQNGAEVWPTVTTTGELERLTGMQPGQAELFLQLVNSRLKELDATAKTLAISKLSCVWWNEPQTAVCPDPKMATYTEHYDAVYSVTTPENSISSVLGRADANAKAMTQAEAGLNCFYVSDAVTADCVTRPNAPRDNMEWVPNDGPNDPEPHRVGFVVIPEGAYISMTSKEQATEFAQQIAYSMLNCFYKSDPIDIECEDENARNSGVDPDVTDPVVVDLKVGDSASKEVPGQHIIIQQGYFTSQLSTVEATYQAKQLADSLLTCCFISRAIHKECDEEASKEFSPVWSYDLVKGAFNSCESQADADLQATLTAESMIQCVYCNKIVPPECVPDWIVTAAVEGITIEGTPFTVQGKTWQVGELYKLDLPLNPVGLINPWTREPEDLSTWSIDATAGIGPDTFCAATLEEAENISAMLNSALTDPVTGVPTCRFKSTRLLAGCGFADPYKPEEGVIADGRDASYVADKSMYGSYGSNKPFGEPKEVLYYASYMPELSQKSGMPELYRVYKSKPTNALSAKLSNPTPGTYIEFPEGFMTASAADIPGSELPADLTNDEARRAVRDYLDGLVLEIAKGMLDCKYSNPRTYVACAWDDKYPSDWAKGYSANALYGDPGAPAWWIGENYNPALCPDEYLAPGGATTRDPIVIPEDSFIGDTYETIRQQVHTLGDSLLNCQCMNAPCACAKSCSQAQPMFVALGWQYVGFTLIEQGSAMEIPGKTIIAPTYAEANALAKKMLVCPTVCLYGNVDYECPCGIMIPENTFISDNPGDIPPMILMMCEILCLEIQIQMFGNGPKIKCSKLEPLELKRSFCMDKDINKQCWGAVVDPFVAEPIQYFTEELPENMFMSMTSQSEANELAWEYLSPLCELAMWTNQEEVKAICTIANNNKNYKCVPCSPESSIIMELRRPAHYKTAPTPEDLKIEVAADFCADCELFFKALVYGCHNSPLPTLVAELTSLEVVTQMFELSSTTVTIVPTLITTLSTSTKTQNAVIKDINMSLNLVTGVQELRLPTAVTELLSNIVAEKGTANIQFDGAFKVEPNISKTTLSYISDVGAKEKSLSVPNSANTSVSLRHVGREKTCPNGCLHIQAPCMTDKGDVATANPSGQPGSGFTIMIDLCLCADASTSFNNSSHSVVESVSKAQSTAELVSDLSLTIDAGKISGASLSVVTDLKLEYSKITYLDIAAASSMTYLTVLSAESASSMKVLTMPGNDGDVVELSVKDGTAQPLSFYGLAADSASLGALHLPLLPEGQGFLMTSASASSITVLTGLRAGGESIVYMDGVMMRSHMSTLDYDAEAIAKQQITGVVSLYSPDGQL